MKIRWACLVPVLPTLALLASPGWAQDYYAAQAGLNPEAAMAAAPGQPMLPQQAMPQQPLMMAPASLPAQGYAQPGYPPPGMYPPQGMPQQAMYGGAPYGVMPAAYQPPPGPLPDAYGAYGSVPTGPAPEGIPMDNAMDMAIPGGGGCPYCGGMGCDSCGGHHGAGGHGLANGLFGDILGICGPYPDGGCAAPRWFDFNLDFMMLKRDDGGRNRDFTSLGVAVPPDDPNIVLRSRMLDFAHEAGFRFQAMFQTGPGSDIEFTYYGTFFWDDRVVVTSETSNLFSVLSQFGTLPFGGFAETDMSDLQFIDYESKFDNFEVNFRCRHVSPNCRYQGSWLWGIRYFKLAEDFNYFTQSTVNGQQLPPPPVPAAFNYNINVNNNLMGLQFGGDLWVCLMPGLRVGGEFKAGVYGNHYNIDNTLESTSVPDPFIEEIKGNDVSLVGNVDLMATYRLNYNWTFKGGYHLLFVDGVALAPEQFNATPPNIFNIPPAPGTVREPYHNDNGTLFYYGWSAGLEFMW
jgi:hypothetical protein